MGLTPFPSARSSEHNTLQTRSQFLAAWDRNVRAPKPLGIHAPLASNLDYCSAERETFPSIFSLHCNSRSCSQAAMNFDHGLHRFFISVPSVVNFGCGLAALYCYSLSCSQAARNPCATPKDRIMARQNHKKKIHTATPIVDRQPGFGFGSP